MNREREREKRNEPWTRVDDPRGRVNDIFAAIQKWSPLLAIDTLSVVLGACDSGSGGSGGSGDSGVGVGVGGGDVGDGVGVGDG